MPFVNTDITGVKRPYVWQVHVQLYGSWAGVTCPPEATCGGLEPGPWIPRNLGGNPGSAVCQPCDFS